MCLLAIAWQADANFKLVVVANRDEYYARPTRPAQFWPDHPELFAGQDLQSNGTWFGVNTRGRFAAITNFRDPKNHHAEANSRGELVSNFLTTQATIEEYSEQIQQQAHLYNGFNLLYCDGHSLMYFCNRKSSPEQLKPGVYGLSNAYLDTPWPKTRNARDQLNQWLKQPGDIQSLPTLLSNPQPAADQELPATGINYTMEKALSSQFIQLDDYGTRCSTALTVDHEGCAEFYERVIHPKEEANAQRFSQFWP